MDAKLSPGTGIVILLCCSTLFASNHVAARIAFDHGTSVGAAVSVRAAGTALVLYLMMRLQGVRVFVPRELRRQALIAGILVAVQSYCLFSAVALIPAALALLVFQTSVMLYVLICWAAGRETPRASSLAAMAFALAGLALVLDVRPAQFAASWAELGAGVLWALGGAVSFAFVYYANAFALKPMDGRLRTFVMTTVTAVLALAGGTAADVLALPREATGWLGLALVTLFYCVALSTLFVVLPKLPPTSSVALNFEPIALLALAWIFLGQAVSPAQVLGAFVTVGAIAWIGATKR
jgi:drug/metabolite transporter (DMT)-like permease